MAIGHRAIRTLVTFVTACTFSFASIATVVSAPPPIPKVVPLVDGGWPKSFVTPSGASVILYRIKMRINPLENDNKQNCDILDS